MAEQVQLELVLKEVRRSWESYRKPSHSVSSDLKNGIATATRSMGGAMIWATRARYSAAPRTAFPVVEMVASPIMFASVPVLTKANQGATLHQIMERGSRPKRGSASKTYLSATSTDFPAASASMNQRSLPGSI